MGKKRVFVATAVVALSVVFAIAPNARAAFSAPSDPAPVHIAFVGDSMADGLWGAMFRRLGKDKCLADKVKLIRHAKNGTGLTRLDQFNWVDEVAALASDPGADLFVGSFGINDRQSIVDAVEDAHRIRRARFRQPLRGVRRGCRAKRALARLLDSW